MTDEEILDDLVERWHFDEEGPESLQEFLGMSSEQFNFWAVTGGIPEGWDAPRGR